ncbi:outer membrane protein assembly factor BamB family protein [Allorhodopirellula solitaria]|nr:PQQ-binding-like beta-propeller repeat protein [Allorhodopirellula solitaria]
MKINRNRTRDWIAGVACSIATTVVATPSQGDWTAFRNGGSSHVEDSLSTQWSAERGIAWQTELQGYGQSAPIIYEGKIYTTSVVGPMCQACAVECRDLQTGALVWSYRHDSTHEHPSNYMNARAAPTPVVDRNGVYAFFETGDLLALDHQGQQKWVRDETKATGELDNSHGIGSSLAQNATHVFVNLEHGGPSFLTAIDKTTGQSTWTADRPSSKSWSSPIVADVNGQQQVIISSGGTVTSYDAAAGEQLWQLDGIEGNSVPSPTVSGQYLVVGARLPEFASAGSVQANCCLDLSEVSDGQPRVVWRADKAICEYASPVVAAGCAYFLNKANVLHCLDLETGDVLYRKRLGGDCWATPIVSDGRLYFFCKNGECKVVGVGPEFQELASNSLWDRDAPPIPETYVESSAASNHSHGQHSHSEHGGGHPGGDAGGHPGGNADSSSSQGPGGGMAARLKAGDRNGDDVLEGDEIPEMFRGMIARIDTDGDGRLSAPEIDAMAASFAERRKDAAASSRDPIVYGVAASDGHIVVRTGTRLFAISQ